MFTSLKASKFKVENEMLPKKIKWTNCPLDKRFTTISVQTDTVNMESVVYVANEAKIGLVVTL